ncbi:MAG: sulfide/dihydroorotate dehydrogenase-like FAD/NAD-binding protein [Bacteroidales bacterium]|nr:sulfide/dihydroorotate dehydrogenase-like FAD/NAD-binding protein [Bacteroidales bacterium]
MYRILSKEMLTPNICRMEVSAPRLAAAAQPGQFLIVRADEKGERIPLTISDYDRDKGSVTIVTQKIGASSSDIVSYETGEEFCDVVGPLGLPSDFVNRRDDELSGSRYVFIAGGLGTAPVYPQVKWLHQHGIAVDVIIGARNKDLLIYTKEIESVCDNLYICTDDGSQGFQGVGTAMLEKLVSEGIKYTQAVAIGPMIMMKFATMACKKLGIPVTVSLNTLMVDGTGMCGACRVTVEGKIRFACVEGPEFNGYDVDFDEAMRRQGQYRAEETEAVEHHKCRIGRGK